jgi:hypothetical protein
MCALNEELKATTARLHVRSPAAAMCGAHPVSVGCAREHQRAAAAVCAQTEQQAAVARSSKFQAHAPLGIGPLRNLIGNWRVPHSGHCREAHRGHRREATVR